MKTQNNLVNVNNARAIELLEVRFDEIIAKCNVMVAEIREKGLTDKIEEAYGEIASVIDEDIKLVNKLTTLTGFDVNSAEFHVWLIGAIQSTRNGVECGKLVGETTAYIIELVCAKNDLPLNTFKDSMSERFKPIANMAWGESTVADFAEVMYMNYANIHMLAGRINV